MNPAAFTPLIFFSLALLLWLNLKLKGLKALKIVLNLLIAVAAIIQIAAAAMLIGYSPRILGLDFSDYFRLWLNYPEYNLTFMTGLISLSFLLMRTVRKNLSAAFIRQNMATVLAINLLLKLRVITKSFSGNTDLIFTHFINLAYQAAHCGITLSIILLLQAVFLFLTPARQTLSGPKY